jgi:hypothetical protein
VRDLVVFGIRNELIEVKRDLATPRGAEARGEKNAVQKLLENHERMEGLRRAKEEADRQIAEKSADAARGGGGGGGGGGRYALPASPTSGRQVASGETIDVRMSPAANVRSVRVYPDARGVVAVGGRKNRTVAQLANFPVRVGVCNPDSKFMSNRTIT